MIHNSKYKCVLVTGATGFIGSHLVEELVKQKFKVISVDINTGRKSYFYQQQLDEKSTFVKINIIDFDKLNALIREEKIDFIFHLAAKTLVLESYNNPRLTLETNIMGTVNILECVRLNKNIKGAVVASSDKAYGKLNPQLTSHNLQPKYAETFPLSGDHPYDVSKSAADLISQTYFKTYRTPVVITRMANVYGEGDLNFSRLIPGLMKAILENKTFEIRSNGKFVRDYLYVMDAVNGYLSILDKFDGIKGESFNFGSYDTLSVIDLIKLTETVLNRKIKYRILNTEKNEIPYQSLDFSKSQKKLGFRNIYKLKNEISDLYKWYREYLKYAK